MDIPEIRPESADGSDDALDRAAQRLFYFELLRYSSLNSRDDFRVELAALRDNPASMKQFCERWGVQQYDVERSLRLQPTTQKPRLLTARTYKDVPTYEELLHPGRRRLLEEPLCAYCNEANMPYDVAKAHLVESAMWVTLPDIDYCEQNRWFNAVRRAVEEALLDGRTLDAKRETAISEFPTCSDVRDFEAFALSRIELDELLSKLTQNERELLLDWTGGWSLEEIATKRQKSASAIKSALDRLKKKVRKLL
jgi:hypothetical protein